MQHESHASLLLTQVTANFDNHDEADEETTSYLQKQIDAAEKDGHASGKPGSLLNRLISHGNKKTEDQMKRESMQQQSSGTQS